MWCHYEGCCMQDGRPSQSVAADRVEILNKPDKQLCQFRLRPLVLRSFSCGCPPQLYLVTVKSAVAAPTGGPSYFHWQPSRKWRVPCYRGRLHLKRFYRKTTMVASYLTDWKQRRTAAVAQPNPACWTVDAARRFSQRRQALYSLRLLRTGSAPGSVLIKWTPSKTGGWSDVSSRWPTRTELTGWWRLICWWLLTEMVTPHIHWHQIFM